MKHRIEILVAILSASVMLLAGCDKTEVSDNTEVDSLRRSIIATINKKIDNVDGQIASLEDELASMRTSKKYKEDDLRLLEEKISAASKRLSDIRNSVALLENSSSSFIEKAEEINSDLESLDSEIASIQVMIQKLKADAADTGGGDLEKIIYVPKYDDRPDSLHYHLDGLKIIGDITLRFVTQPQESASSIAENWETSLSAHAIYDGDEFDLAITDVSANSDGLLFIHLSADSLPQSFVLNYACADVKIFYREEPICSFIRVFAIVDEPAILTMLRHLNRGDDGQIIDDLKEMTSFDTYDYLALKPYFDLFFATMPALTSLSCSQTDLTTLDLSNNPALTELYCYDNSSLTTLDVSNHLALEKLICYGNSSLMTLDVSNNPALTTLWCYNNSRLTTLDTSSNPALMTLDCNNNNLSTLDLSNNPALTALDCNNNNLSTLDLSNNPALTALNCSKNGLTTLNLSNSLALTTLKCYESSSLTTLDVSNCPAFTKLDCEGSRRLTTIDVSNCSALTMLDCYGLPSLTTLDASNNPSLTKLFCDGCNLTTLNVSNCPALAFLSCEYNENLKALDVSDASALTTLWIRDNTALVSLKVSTTVKLVVTEGLSPSIYQIGQYVSIDNATGIVYKTSSPAIVSTDETSDTWSDGKAWVRWGWSMPKLKELEVIYNNKSTLNSTLSSIGVTQFSSTCYWSSSEYNGNSAYCLDFSSGSSFSYDKDNSIMVRAVRAL